VVFKDEAATGDDNLDAWIDRRLDYEQAGSS
jgi:hypothetical protein